MQALSTTRLSSKGQVVIPEEVRDRLGLETGVQFVVVGDWDVVILKVISPPSRVQAASPALVSVLTDWKATDARAGGMAAPSVSAIRSAVRAVTVRLTPQSNVACEKFDTANRVDIVIDASSCWSTV